MKGFKIWDDWVKDTYFSISAYLFNLTLKLNVSENSLKLKRDIQITLGFIVIKLNLFGDLIFRLYLNNQACVNID